MKNTGTALCLPADGIAFAKARGFSVSRRTMLRWIPKHGLGHRVGGKWYVDLEKLRIYLEGQLTNDDGTKTNAVPRRTIFDGEDGFPSQEAGRCGGKKQRTIFDA